MIKSKSALVLCCGRCYTQLTYILTWASISLFALACRTGGLFLLCFAGCMKLCFLAKTYCLFKRYLYSNLLCRCSWAYDAIRLHNLQAIIAQGMFKIWIKHSTILPFGIHVFKTNGNHSIFTYYKLNKGKIY